MPRLAPKYQPKKPVFPPLGDDVIDGVVDKLLPAPKKKTISFEEAQKRWEATRKAIESKPLPRPHFLDQERKPSPATDPGYLPYASKMTYAQYLEMKKGRLIEPQSIGQLLVPLMAGADKWNYMEGPQGWTNWQTRGIDTPIGRLDLKGLTDFGVSLAADPSTYLIPGSKQAAQQTLRMATAPLKEAAKEAKVYLHGAGEFAGKATKGFGEDVLGKTVPQMETAAKRMAKEPYMARTIPKAEAGMQKGLTEGRVPEAPVTPAQATVPPPPPVSPPPGVSGLFMPSTPDIQGAVEQVITALKQGSKLQATTRAMQHKERALRVSKALKAIRDPSLSTPEAMKKAKQAYKGELPRPELTKLNIAPEAKTLLEDTIRNTPAIVDTWTYTRNNAFDALQKVFNGQLPTKGEIELLEQIFGPEMSGAIRRSLPTSDKILAAALDVLNIPRVFKASWDLSAPMRQGLWLQTRHITRSAPNMGRMVRAMASEKYGQAIDDFYRGNVEKGIAPDPHWVKGQEYGLYYAPYKRGAGTLVQREESFMSKIAEKIPGVRQSERAYVTYLNKLRQDVWKYYYDILKNKGASDADFDALADFINKATGRGTLGALENAAPLMSTIFFSPRMVAATVELPFTMASSSPIVRRIAMENIGSTLAAGSGLLFLAWAGGLDVEPDPRSADFAKVRIGDTRIDFWGGKQQYNVLLARLATGQYKSSTTGQITNMGPSSFAGDRIAAMTRFGRSKLAPGPALGTDIAVGENFMGEPMSTSEIPRIVRDTFAPMAIDTSVSAFKEGGATMGVPLTAAGIIGMNTAVYTSLSAEVMRAWAGDFKSYAAIPTDSKEAKKKKMLSRDDYRKKNPEIDAKLFISGQTTALKTDKAVSLARKMIEEYSIDPMSIKGVKEAVEKKAYAEQVARDKDFIASVTDTRATGQRYMTAGEWRSESKQRDFVSGDTPLQQKYYEAQDKLLGYEQIFDRLAAKNKEGAYYYKELNRGGLSPATKDSFLLNSQYRRFKSDYDRARLEYRYYFPEVNALLKFWESPGLDLLTPQAQLVYSNYLKNIDQTAE